MRTLIQLIICLVVAWGAIAALWPELRNPSRDPLKDA
jgi:hypothetical protein